MRHGIWRGLLLLAAIVAMVLVAACGDASDDDPATGETAAPTAARGQTSDGEGTTVNVTARNFSFSLDTTEAPAGPVTFVLSNEGPATHDFAISGNGVDEATKKIKKGETDSFTVDLKPGTYHYHCTIGGHAAAGMEGEFTVR